MRIYLLLILSIAAANLGAQRNKSAGKNGWEISASFSPDLDKTVITENAQFEFIPENVPISQRPRSSFDTVMIGGVDRLFNRGGATGLRIKPAEADFWYAANVKVHRRLAAFDFAGGLYYSSGGYTSLPTETNEDFGGVVSSSTTVLYEVADVRSQNIGLETSMHYHLLKKFRVHPYVGGGVLLLHNRTERQVNNRVHSEDLSVLLDSPNAGVNQVNSSFNLELVVSLGVIYEVTEQWSVALEVNGQHDFARGLVGLQVRRML
ncbi:hypothetical protein [Neolewinella persica]|uniref:hypothetical protein n=1 Tax=Neolewinella persica TaxID=70998 RepID=UPI00036A07FA|nr:hypothetical protein [Neolewinella persica]